MPTADGRTAAQMSMNGCPTISTSGERTLAAILVSLEPATRWSTSTPRRRPGRGGEARDDGRQVVDALQVLHHDADVAQVVAPDLLHQLGVVLALDVDPAGPGHLGPGPLAAGAATEPEAVRVGPRPGPAGAGGTSVTGWPSSRNAAGVSGKTRRLPCRSSSVTAPFS